MKNAKICQVILFTILIMIILTSCSNSYLERELTVPTLPSLSTPGQDGNTENKYENAKGHMRLGVYGFDTLHPLKTKNKMLQIYMTLVYDAPFSMGKDSLIEPQIIEEWDTPDGGVTWNFKTKENVRFHDGANCTAYDIKATIEWIIANGGAYTECAKGIVSFKILSVYEIQITLEKADSFFPCKMIFPVMKSDDLEAQSYVPNGTGRYKYVRQNAANGFTFELYKDYYGKFPKIASIKILNYETAEELYRSNADIMLFFNDNVIKYNTIENGIVCRYGDSTLSCLVPSSKTDVSVRHYINGNLDKRLLLLGAVAGAGTCQTVPFADETYYLKELSNVITQSGKKPETIRIIVNQSERDLVRLANLIKSQLEEKQISCELTECKQEEFTEALKTEEYDFVLMNLQMGLWPEFQNLSALKGEFNFEIFSDSSLDSLITSLKNAYINSDSTGVKDINTFAIYAEQQMGKIVQRFCEILPAIGLYNRDASVILKNTVKNVDIHNFTYWNTLASFNNWSVEES